MSRTIYHNPWCPKSRATLALLKKSNAEVSVVEYLTDTSNINELKRILVLLGMTPRELLRQKDAENNGISDPDLSDDTLLVVMVANPGVIERPIVISRKKATIGRPLETALDTFTGTISPLIIDSAITASTP